MTGLWGLVDELFEIALCLLYSVYFLLLTRPLLVLLPVFKLVDFMEFKLGFHGMWGHAGYVVWVQTYFWLYIYIYICCCVVTLWLQVAAGCFCVCFVSLSCF